MQTWIKIDKNSDFSIGDIENSDELVTNNNYESFDKSIVKEVIFVDSSVDNYTSLLEGVDLNKLLSGELEIGILDRETSGIKQITDYLDQYSNQIESVHIVSHGDVAELYLGSVVVDNSSLNNFADSLLFIFKFVYV